MDIGSTVSHDLDGEWQGRAGNTWMCDHDENSESSIYKQAEGCALQADVYVGYGAGPRPVIVWLHGGALMLGNRGMIHPGHLERYREAGYTVVAIDYRLAPESKLPDIWSDVRDAIDWVRTEGSGQFAIDPSRLAIIGHSAGGYLTLLAGCTVQPRPQALVSFYGYGDIVGPWYSQPSPFYCQQPLVSGEEAHSVVGTTPLSSSPTRANLGPDEPDRSQYYLYCRQRGIWPRAATGHHPITERATLLPFCPFAQATADYPPTLLLHGDRDTDVPYEQSVMMAAALAANGVKHDLVTIAGGEHVFDWRENDPVVDAVFERVLDFLDRYLKPV
jgi:acetyl esterase/lipase